jgi:hypothetical protein
MRLPVALLDVRFPSASKVALSVRSNTRSPESPVMGSGKKVPVTLYVDG